MTVKRVTVLGAAGRVGSQICSELMRHGCQLALVDRQPQAVLEACAGRLLNDAWLASGQRCPNPTVFGDFDALNKAALTELFATQQPDLVINYAIPITWDATKRLPNYHQISAAGLGAFTPIQVSIPLLVGQALHDAGLSCPFMVGNLPDITAPIIAAIAQHGGVVAPTCGAGNVALNQIALRRHIATEHGVAMDDVEVALVSHHIHWVAPREPGYSNAAPYLARVCVNGADVTPDADAMRAQMKAAVQRWYEDGAAFSSTTGILASRVALALIDDTAAEHKLHTPAPNGLPGGYPVAISGGKIRVDLPEIWALEDAIEAMQQCHTFDGVQAIHEDGSVAFTELARNILQQEVGFDLPAIMAPGDIEAVSTEQVRVLSQLFSNS